jgi:hypothetical protein
VSMHHLRARLVALCMVAALLQLTIVATMAAGPRQERFERPNCVVFIDPVAEGETTSRVHSARCFSTFAEAMAYASGGRLKLAANASRDQYSLAELSASTAGVTIIGRDYEDPNYSCNIFGPCLDWTVNNDFGCTGGRNYVASSMPTVDGFNWNDQLSSTKAFAGCSRNQNFEHANYGGALRNCLPNCATMGVMNDATSSKQWRDV